MENQMKPQPATKSGSPTTEVNILSPETIFRPPYRGKIVSIHDGYVFINKIEKHGRSWPMSFDLFSPIPKHIVFSPGQTVIFTSIEANPDQPGHFRTNEVMHEKDWTRIVKCAMQTQMEPLPYHTRIGFTDISQESYKKVLLQKPFTRPTQTIKWPEVFRSDGNKEIVSFNKLINGLIDHFTALPEFDTNCAEVKALVLCYLESNCPRITQAKENGTDQEIRTLIEGMRHKFPVQHKSLINEKNRYYDLLEKANSFINSDLTFSKSLILNFCYLPELIAAFPIWFYDALPDVNALPNNLKDGIRVGSLSDFDGPDIMLPTIQERLAVATEFFDSVVIMTAYHMPGLKQPDPILCGFFDYIPYAFIFGRWSGGSMLSLFPQLVDSTMSAIHDSDSLLYKSMKEDKRQAWIKAYLENRLFDYLSEI